MDPPEGTYLAWLNCRQLAIPRTTTASTTFAVATDIDGPAKLFRDEARVALNSGHIFGSGGDGFSGRFARVSMSSPSNPWA